MCRKASLILMDYPAQQRLKLWVEINVQDAKESNELMQQLEMPEYKARIERLVTLKIQAYDWNCPQHITLRYTTKEVEGLS